MSIDADIPPDPQGPDAAWEGLDPRGAGFEDSEAVMAAREQAALDAPDTVDHLIEVVHMQTICAAQALLRVNELRHEALADAARHGRILTDVVERSIRLEIAAALRITENAAGRMMTMSEALVHRYPAVLDSFSAARMSERHAEILVETLDGVEPEFREGVLARGVQLAESEPLGAFRRRLRALVETVRAATLDDRHEQALDRRRVVLDPGDDAMAWIMLYIPAVEARAVFERATRMAKVLAAQEGEKRTLDQLRADVVSDLLIEGDTFLHPAEARGIRSTVAVTVPALALLEEQLRPGSAPATVEGVGPIPLHRARELCGAADGWMRILTHPETGMVLSVGREQYRPPPALRRLVRWRADRCIGPGCGMPASRCEIDHQIAWEHGGDTSLNNLSPLCKGHHIVKHHGGWVVRQVDGGGGAIEWTSPTGRRYVVEPERRVPVFRPHEEADAPF
ncbi:DUF222 domain-containing protein [uncultured Microbacterium sp.]|uniref:HNH endonuclease signature motif containing protein n=1 Tax=uncultured Microbacterium sp. TaxID=191216 RepID=UPI0028D06542|nr:DUF222 domain-containing protein [uncultured Microbacterium sp.]